VGGDARAKRLIGRDFRYSREDGLTRDGQAINLEPRVQALLDYLLDTPGRTVLKSELLHNVWPDAHVTEASIHQAAKKLRSAFGDSAKPFRFVQTVPKKGYKFIAPVTPLAPPGVAAAVDQESAVANGAVEHSPESPLVDRSRFVRDITMPDGSVVKVKQRFVKQWEIENVGNVPWVDRYLVRQGPAAAPGRLESSERVPIPKTMPGERCVLSVELTAPSTPGSCYAEWKMTDAHGKKSLPDQLPVYISVDVKY